MIYLDNAATTCVVEDAIRAAEDAMRSGYFNPNTTYKSGVEARTSIENCRHVIAQAVGASADELVFTSGATESNNWIINNGRKNRKGNVVISAGEHSSVYEPAMQLIGKGVDVRIVPLTKCGAIDEEAFINAVDKDTSLVSVIHVSNEIGVINPIKKLAVIVKSRAPRAAFHCDGVQGMLKTHEPLNGLGVDFYSASAHKLGAPKGIGLLYIRRGISIAPMIYGGGQEKGLRSGTQNTPYIAAFAEAVRKFRQSEDRERTKALRNELCEYFVADGCKIIGDGDNSGYILCVCVPNVKAEILQNLVYEKGVVIGKGAACSGSKRGNRVLSSIGLSGAQIESCIRISLFTDTNRDDALRAVRIISETANSIRSGNVG